MTHIDKLYNRIYEEVDKDYIKEKSIKYTPNLNEDYLERLNCLAQQVQKSKIDSKIEEVEKEIEKFGDGLLSEDIEYIRYKASIYVLRDLMMQGWRFYYDDKIYLSNPEFTINDKDILKLRLECEKKGQFDIESNKKFIIKMEKERIYEGEKISIKNLIGNKDELIDKIKAFKAGDKNDIVEPYLQIVEDKKDIYTGYNLKEIWRYFRYTWSIPYKNTPGRNIYYLIRDKGQKYNPIIGIAALGNCVINLTPRDNYIGWTIEEIKISLENVKHDNEKIIAQSKNKIELLKGFIDNEINEIYYKDLLTCNEFNNPTQETIKKLVSIYNDIKDIPTKAKTNHGEINYLEETQMILYKKKRSLELSKLFEAKLILGKLNSEVNLLEIIDKSIYKKAINIALKANRKVKIGSNIMEIIVCGSIPPYNELLGGKLVSLMITSPVVIKDYRNRYKNQVSEIASRMKGEKIVRDSDLAFLGTTSLYSMGSSQYNRISMKINDNFTLKYREIGKTEGYGSVFFSNQTTDLINKMLLQVNGDRKINNVFGEGASPRMRLIVSGLRALGINSKEFLNHYSPRIVYGINLAENSKEYLNGYDSKVNYYFNEGEEEIYTKQIIDFWKTRWLNRRIYNVDIENRLRKLEYENILVSKVIDK